MSGPQHSMICQYDCIFSSSPAMIMTSTNLPSSRQDKVDQKDCIFSSSPSSSAIMTSTNQISSRNDKVDHRLTMDETMVDRLRAMIRQESRFYQIASCNHHRSFKTPSSQDSSLLAVDESYRRTMSHWYVSFCDVCGIDQDTAATVMRNLDRYTFLPSSSSLSALNSKTEYQMVSITLLYTTIKVMETDVVSPQALADVSRGTCVASDIIDMESTILEELEWHLYPPTAFGFVRCILEAFDEDALPERVRESALQQAFDSIHESKLVLFPSSIVAMAAIANALDENKANIDSVHILWLTLLEAMEGIS
eukprot:scaffold37072_cov43-Attheya_sp.AAC.2